MEDRFRSINQMILNVKGRHAGQEPEGRGGMFGRDMNAGETSRRQSTVDGDGSGDRSKQKGKAPEQPVASTSTHNGNGNGAGAGGPNAKPPLPRGSACLICRKRKLRCDGQRPKCATCARLGHECGYGGQEGSMERLSEYASILEEKIRAPLSTLNRDLRH